jgi:hypothetical protein
MISTIYWALIDGQTHDGAADVPKSLRHDRIQCFLRNFFDRTSSQVMTTSQRQTRGCVYWRKCTLFTCLLQQWPDDIKGRGQSIECWMHILLHIGNDKPWMDAIDLRNIFQLSTTLNLLTVILELAHRRCNSRVNNYVSG